MAARRAADKAINTQLQKGRKSTQLERLHSGMVAAANQSGYAGATVSEVIAHAGVSRPTFYDYFADRDECFVACVQDAHSQLLEKVRAAVGAQAHEDALARAIEAHFAFAVTEPGPARLLMTEALAGPAAALDAREEGTKKIARIVERAASRAPAGRPIPDVPVAIVIGAVQRLLGSRLCRGERAMSTAREELLAWVTSYARPAKAHRWHAAAATGAVAPSPFLPSAPARAPDRLGPGRPRLPEDEVAENHRLRIIFATSQAIAQRGYAGATITEITKLAGVDGRAFYRTFSDKQEAFEASYEHGLHQTLAIVARAYFAGDSWPERMWEALRVVTQSAQRNPAGAYAGLVAAPAVGPAATQRVQDSRIAFTIFLQEGYRYGQYPSHPPPLALEAIVTSVFEALYCAARKHASRNAAGLLAPVTYLCLTPFLGVEDAELLIDEKLSEEAGRPKQERTRHKPAKRVPAATRVRSRDALRAPAAAESK
jgi:AcrR family transcriptional regulator